LNCSISPEGEDKKFPLPLGGEGQACSCLARATLAVKAQNGQAARGVRG